MTTAPEATSPPQHTDRRTARRQETRAEIVAAAWELVRSDGVAGLALRDLGDRVGMKAQSLYSYFGSKLDIYDAMYREGYLAFETAMAEALERAGGDPLAQAHAAAHGFFQFCTSDPVRYQLLFQRTIPDFEPSEESFAVALRVHDALATMVADLGIDDPAEALDLFTGVLTGLASQQISNDPGGDRWGRLIDRTVDMTLREIAPHLFTDSRGAQQ